MQLRFELRGRVEHEVLVRSFGTHVAMQKALLPSVLHRVAELRQQVAQARACIGLIHIAMPVVDDDRALRHGLQVGQLERHRLASGCHQQRSGGYFRLVLMMLPGRGRSPALRRTHRSHRHDRPNNQHHRQRPYLHCNLRIFHLTIPYR